MSDPEPEQKQPENNNVAEKKQSSDPAKTLSRKEENLNRYKVNNTKE